MHTVLLCFGVCVLIAFAGYVLKTTNHVLERAEKQAEIFCVFLIFVSFSLQQQYRRKQFFVCFSFFSFSQAQSETHMTKRILVGGNEAVCTARRR